MNSGLGAMLLSTARNRPGSTLHAGSWCRSIGISARLYFLKSAGILSNVGSISAPAEYRLEAQGAQISLNTEAAYVARNQLFSITEYWPAVLRRARNAARSDSSCVIP